MCFVALPLRKPFTDYCEAIVKPAALEVGLSAVTSGDVFGTGPIIQDIWTHIWRSAIVIADVTDKNPNVNYELGLCHALGVPTIIISQKIEDVPFDYKHRRCIIYDTTDVHWQTKLKQNIVKTISKVLGGEPYQDELAWPYDTMLLRETKRVGAFVSSQDATADVIRGARLVRDAVAKSYGPHGVTVQMRVREQEYQLRNGRDIAGNTWSQNRLETAGITAMRRVANSMKDRVGDGTKLAIVLVQEFIERGYAAIKNGCLPRDVVYGMDTAVEKAISLVKLQSKAVTEADLLAVARSAAVGDAHVARVVVEAMKRTGKDGIILVEHSPLQQDSIEFIEGMHFDTGFMSQDFITNPATGEAVLENAYVLICEQKLRSTHDLLPLLEQIAKTKQPLLIIAESVEDEAFSTLLLNKQKGTLLAIPVKCPGFSDRRRVLLEDIAIVTGGTVITRDSGNSVLSHMALSHLGRAKKVTVTQNQTFISGGAGSTDAVQSRAQTIRRQIEFASADLTKKNFENV